MNLLSVFVDSRYEIRNGWRFVLYIVLLAGMFTGAAIGAVEILHLLGIATDSLTPGSLGFLGLNAGVLLTASTGALWVMARSVEGAPLSSFGTALHKGCFRDLTMGLGVAGAMLGCTLTGAFLLGDVHLEWHLTAAALPSFGATVLILAVSAFNEELIFRGYPLQTLARAVTPWKASILVSSLFGILHVGNPDSTAMSVFNTILAGLMLAAAYFKARSLWLPYGIHIGWNAGLAVILGFPMSGLRTASMWTGEISGPAAILGGSYGPEGGLMGTVIFGGTALVILKLRRERWERA